MSEKAKKGLIEKMALRFYDLHFTKSPDELLDQIYKLVKIRARVIAIYKERGLPYKKVFIDVKDTSKFEIRGRFGGQK